MDSGASAATPASRQGMCGCGFVASPPGRQLWHQQQQLQETQPLYCDRWQQLPSQQQQELPLRQQQVVDVSEHWAAAEVYANRFGETIPRFTDMTVHFRSLADCGTMTLEYLLDGRAVHSLRCDDFFGRDH